MGISAFEILQLIDQGALSRQTKKILDIGCQNLHGATVEELNKIMGTFGTFDPQAQATYVAEVAAGSGKTPNGYQCMGAYFGELMERCGIAYRAYDLFEGFQTQLFDLNQEAVPDEHVGQYDLVMNCGTTEHLIGQHNAMKVIHDATKVGGYIYHSLPHLGYLDHGYFNYQPKLFMDLAQANGYRGVHFQISAIPALEHKISDDYQDFFEVDHCVIPEVYQDVFTANVGNVHIILQKVQDTPFKVPMDISTTLLGTSLHKAIAEENQAEEFRFALYQSLVDNQMERLRTLRDVTLEAGVARKSLLTATDDPSLILSLFTELWYLQQQLDETFVDLNDEKRLLEVLAALSPESVEITAAHNEVRRRWLATVDCPIQKQE